MNFKNLLITCFYSLFLFTSNQVQCQNKIPEYSTYLKFFTNLDSMEILPTREFRVFDQFVDLNSFSTLINSEKNVSKQFEMSRNIMDITTRVMKRYAKADNNVYKSEILDLISLLFRSTRSTLSLSLNNSSTSSVVSSEKVKNMMLISTDIFNSYSKTNDDRFLSQKIQNLAVDFQELYTVTLNKDEQKEIKNYVNSLIFKLNRHPKTVELLKQMVTKIK